MKLPDLVADSDQSTYNVLRRQEVGFRMFTCLMERADAGAIHGARSSNTDHEEADNGEIGRALAGDSPEPSSIRR